MKKTLLEIVKNMLVAIDSENVDGVGDTEEAGMCVEIANQEYERIISKYVHWKHLRKYASLSATTNLNEMECPSGTLSIDPNFVYYDKQKVTYIEPDRFMYYTLLRADDTNITNINGVNVYTDRKPQFFTTDNNETLRFDAITDPVDGLNGNLTMVLAYVAPTSALTGNDEYFDLPATVYPALMSFCRATALANLKGELPAAQAERREAIKALGAAIRTHKLIDGPVDIRDNIIPRRTRRAVPLNTN